MLDLLYKTGDFSARVITSDDRGVYREYCRTI